MRLDQAEARRTPLHTGASLYASLSLLTIDHGKHNNFLGLSSEVAQETAFLSAVPPGVNKVTVITEGFILAKECWGI